MLGVIAWLVPGGKATMLGIWVVWCLLLIAVNGYALKARGAGSRGGHQGGVIDDAEIKAGAKLLGH